MQKPVIYTPIPLDPQKAQIRLLRLQPRRDGEEISCGIEVVDLDDAETIEYNSLSYEWGTADATEYILLAGCKTIYYHRLK